MTNKIPDFFKNRVNSWCFDDVLDYIHFNFIVKENFVFRVGDKNNNSTENQRAGLVLAYTKLMDYTFNQVKALFSEHNHFAIAMPEPRKDRNILEINRIFLELLRKGASVEAKINNYTELFDIPGDVLTLKNK